MAGKGSGGLIGMGIILFIVVVVAAFGPSLFSASNAGASFDNSTPQGQALSAQNNATNQMLLGGLTINMGIMVIVGVGFILLVLGMLLSGGRR